MASYHLSVKTIKRSAGRSATAAAAYRSASVIACDREGRMHDYTAKRGVETCFILAPADAPSWAQDRAALWNAAYNIGFDWVEGRLTGRTADRRPWPLRIAHALGFETGLLIMTLPIVFPLLTGLGYDAIWLGVLITILIEIGMLTPPVGMNIFVLVGVAKGEVKLGEAAVAALPYWLILLALIGLIIAMPRIVTFLPDIITF